MRPEQTRTYDRASSVVFLKTDEPFGGLSNMAGGLPLRVNGIRIRTSEALYQACRFPHRPNVQNLIIEQNSPMTAKMKSKPYRHDSRPDWDQVRVKIMRWCLRVKLAQNWRAFSELLLETDERPIVEESRKDDFWGAKATDDGTLVGMNVLGRLLMELREAVKAEDPESLMHVKPLGIPNFLLGGRPIEAVTSQTPERDAESGKAAVTPVRGDADRQPSLFNEAAVREAPPAAYSAGRAKSVHVADLKPYAAYKESGLPWLGQVPGHWDTRRLRHACDMRVSNVDKRTKVSETPVRLCNYVEVYKNERIRESTRFMVATASEDERVRFGLHKGDVLITKDSEQWNDIGVPALVEFEAPDLVCGYHLAILRARPGLGGAFLHRALESHFIAAQFHVEANGVTRYGLSHGAIQCVTIPFPPSHEQAAIVRFLDWANGRLERAIRAKRKVIALLGEQKQVIIHRAVTRGLDPSVPLKPSGIPWLGEIPQHWELWRIGRFARVGNGSTPSRAKPSYWRGGTYPWLNSSQVNRCHIDSADQFVTRVALHECHLPKVPAGSVLVAITGQGKTRGMSATLAIEATINQHIAFITPRLPLASPEFIHLALTAAYRQLRALSDDSGSTKGAITCEDLKHFKLPMPPRAEQDELLRSIQIKTREVDAASTRLEREIDLLREYRTRLVADVVTGKLDVREVAARLPDDQDSDFADDTQAEREDDDMTADAAAE
jgi:type I restriction enzyme S subunit